MNSPADLPEAKILPARRRFSLIWFVPVLSAGLLALFLWQSQRQRGPLVMLSFEDARGLETGSTLRYRGLDAGVVERLELNENLDQVVVYLRLSPTAASLAREGSRFWVVRMATRTRTSRVANSSTTTNSLGNGSAADP